MDPTDEDDDPPDEVDPEDVELPVDVEPADGDDDPP